MVKKLITAVSSLLFVTMLSFLLMRLSPVDPATAYVKRNSAIVTEEQITAARIELGLDRPLILQYTDWVAKAIRLDFGISLGTGHPVTRELKKTIPVTFTVVALSAVIMGVCSILLGLFSWALHGRIPGMLLQVVCMAGISVPAFYLGTAFLDFFAIRLKLIQITGNSGIFRYLPIALCLSVSGICFYSQLLAGSLVHEMDEDYAVYAKCRGLSDLRILFCHALPQALIDLIPSFAQMIGLCLAGAAIVERVFSLPGLGYLIIDSVMKRDSPVIHAAVLFLALALVLLDTAAILLQGLLQKNTNGREADYS